MVTTILGALRRRRLRKLRIERKARIGSDSLALKAHCERRLATLVSNAPALRAVRGIEDATHRLDVREAAVRKQWKEAYERFSWWDKMKHGPDPDLSRLHRTRDQLTHALARLRRRHGEDLKELDAFAARAAGRAAARTEAAGEAAIRHVESTPASDWPGNRTLEGALWLSMLSVPLSAWSDIARASDIHDILRTVHTGYAGMSDADIWFATLTMPAESLAGLTSLVKGAYFETLVAADTGGSLHEHFNHPDTDIVIDGVAFQVKATDSVAYVNGVDEDIPVIATTEVADLTAAIDGGHANLDLTESVELALGGTVVDATDAGVDAILAGLGGVGLFASMAGLSRAVARYEDGDHPLDAAVAGAGVALERTARATVGTAELGYRALTSGPARAMGRGIWRSGGWVAKRL